VTGKVIWCKASACRIFLFWHHID